MSTANPLVSIVVPVFNGEAYLRESLDSVLAQTYDQIEILVMDDASTDRTPEILASYGNRLNVHCQESNRGQFANVNDGISRARGAYLCVYHSDDVYEPNIVEREAEFLERFPEVGAVFAQDIFIDPQGRPTGRLKLLPELRGERPLDFERVFNALLTHKNCFLRGPSAMVRAAVYSEVGPYRGEEFRIAADLEMWVRISHRYPIGILDEHLFRYRHGHGNLSQRYDHLRGEPERFFQIMDGYLSQGARSIASPPALVAYEGHRAEDRLLLAVNQYILGDLASCRGFLRGVRGRDLLRCRYVQRGRLLSLLWMLRLLVRVPRVPAIADLFYRRWHAG